VVASPLQNFGEQCGYWLLVTGYLLQETAYC